MRRNDLLGRLVGIFVFLCGVGLLVFVFSMTYSFFHAPLSQLPTAPARGSTETASSQLGRSALALLARIGMLVVMTIIGSVMASRGVQLYFAAMHHRPRPPVEPVEPTE